MFGRLAAVVFLAGLLTAWRASAAEPPAPEPPAEGRDKIAALHVGTSADKVRELLGPPKRIARQILSARYVEQWTYDDPAVRVEFDWRKGQAKQIQGVRPLTTPPR